MKYPEIALKEGMEQDWKKFCRNNSDDYGRAVVDYIGRWAQLMEKRIEATNDPFGTIYEDAERLSHEADTDGITGFMFGCAVSVLAQVWEYGDILREWHNARYDYVDNSIVNPAVFTVEVPDE